tara:strand:+ start:141 stop:620 length:480 start_codon:yes stop_codon:yes gene_type:complete
MQNISAISTKKRRKYRDKVDFTDLIRLFDDAAETDRLMPSIIRKQKMSSWVDYPDEITAYGYTRMKDLVRIVPDQIQIDRWEIATKMLMEIEDANMRKVIWAKAKGATWVWLGKKTKLSRQWIRQKYLEALIVLAFRINKTVKKNINKLYIINKITYDS